MGQQATPKQRRAAEGRAAAKEQCGSVAGAWCGPTIRYEKFGSSVPEGSCLPPEPTVGLPAPKSGFRKLPTMDSALVAPARNLSGARNEEATTHRCLFRGAEGPTYR